ncbi:hypothetical protein BHE74_00052653 [Ensete ventricosum]|nr:hypothetical protein GW17_00053576 [Ensete ventricosum]RWW41829.1 hypothetical protein BHE74_00052653 [Ensete ventricosum]RZS01992.1 hypothetical protein BHM03_00031953 [Ensete ventricosum]
MRSQSLSLDLCSQAPLLLHRSNTATPAPLATASPASLVVAALALLVAIALDPLDHHCSCTIHYCHTGPTRSSLLLHHLPLPH